MLKLYTGFKRAIMLLCFSVFTLSAFSTRYTVTNTSSNVATVGSLAWAINQANTVTPGATDTIEFNIPDGTSCTFNLTSILPDITDALFINGYSQPGAVAGPIATREIRININAAGIGAGNNAFFVNANNVTIAGLAIYGAPQFGIKTSTTGISNLHIWGNFIGTDSTGIATGLADKAGGVEVNLLGGNYADNIVVGVNGDGTNDASEGNLITSSTSTSVNNGDGVILWRCSNSMVAGNIVGLNKNGISTPGLGNTRDGIVMTVSCITSVIGTDGDGTSDALEGNLVGNNRSGIFMAASSNGNIIAGNTVGIDLADGDAGNNAFGIYVMNASSNQVGTNANGVSDMLERNIIGFNTTAGLRISNESFFGFEAVANDNQVKGNIIGSNAALSLSAPNGNGVELNAAWNFAVNNNFFGTDHDGVNDAVERNVILNNTGNGIQVFAPAPTLACTGNKFSGNLIYNNGGLGIDLQGGTEFSGITINDDGDGDTGANDLLNAPVITSVQIDGANLVIAGFTRPSSMVEFYIPDAEPIPGGGFTKSFGQGQTFLFRAQEGATMSTINDDDATTGVYTGGDEGSNAGGNRTENKFSFTIPLASLPVSVTAGTRITSIAYLNATGAGSTSEFGGVAAAVNLPVHFVSFDGRIRDGKALLTWVTAEEQNNSHFEIQRSATGGSYTTIGKVNPKSGLTNQYDFTDDAPFPGTSYYRLKQVDLDGRSMFSKILILRSDLEKFVVKAGPNPFAGNINIFYQLEKEEAIQVRLYDQSGRAVKQYATRGGAGANTYTINDLNTLPRGHYTLEIAGETVKFRQQIVKQ